MQYSNTNSAEILDTSAEDDDIQDYYEEFKKTYGADVLKLYELVELDCGASEIGRQILVATHNKGGKIDLADLRKLDADNLAAALRLIEAIGVPFRLPNSVLFDFFDGAQVEALISGKRYDGFEM